MTQPARFQVGQKALIDRDGEVLVVFFPNGWLDLPGGRIDEGETDLAAALQREVREETSLAVEMGSPFATWLGRGGTAFLVAYRCRYVSGEVVLSDEHVAYQWVSQTTYEALPDHTGPYEILGRYFESLDS